MKPNDVLRHRLANQQITRHSFSSPAKLIEWFGAVQAQDFPMAKWALGLRLKSATDARVETAFNSGEILRTHVLRPTWHFVHPADVRWMLQLTASRIHQLLGSNNRKLELDKTTFTKAIKTLEKSLQGGRHMTRPAITEAFKKAKINTNDLRLTHLLLHAELEGVICSGPKAGKQFTYMLLEERVPPSAPKTREEALAELTKRYFQSHGPATVKDFAWWSGLTIADAKNGITLLGESLMGEAIKNETYYHFNSIADTKAKGVFLLPNFDEYYVGYANRDIIIDAEHKNGLSGFATALLGNSLVIDGKVAGSWRRTIKKNDVTVEVKPFSELSQPMHIKIHHAIKAFTDFAL